MKITPSILLNIVLVTVLATSLFFISTTASTAEYNPWSDIDGDGDIDIYDVVKVTGIYHTLGDPTRNVNITNFPLDEQGNLKVKLVDYYYENDIEPVPEGEFEELIFETAGYRQVTISWMGSGTEWVMFFHFKTSYVDTNRTIVNYSPDDWYWSRTFAVKGLELVWKFANLDHMNATHSLIWSVYMTT